MELTQQDLIDARSTFNYDSATGVLSWAVKDGKHRRGGNRNEGKPIGTVCMNGYLKFVWRGRTWLTHRMIWWITNGQIPRCIDHINGVRDDNRLTNLRPADHRQNQHNTGTTGRNKSGVKGVSFCKQTGKWKAAYTPFKGVQKTIGRYDTIEAAAKARAAVIAKCPAYDPTYYRD